MRRNTPNPFGKPQFIRMDDHPMPRTGLCWEQPYESEGTQEAGMGFDLFMAAVAIVVASIATWGILRFFLGRPPTDGDPTGATSASGKEPPTVGPSTENRPNGPAAGPDTASSGTERPENPASIDAVEPPDDGHRHIALLLGIATLLTIPTFVVTMLMLGNVTMPDWWTNPWLHAIAITPVMFYCGAPIHRCGLPALQRRTPNADSLISLGMSIVYVYSLLLCVVSWIFPAGSRDPYFAFVGVVVMLALAIRLVRQKLVIIRFPFEHDATGAEDALLRTRIGHVIHTRVLQITTAVTMIVAVWTFALWLVFGVQPKLAIAVLIAATVLSVAGLVLETGDRPSSL